MKLSKFLSEDSYFLDEKSKQFIEIIKEDCSYFLKESKGNILLRGMHRTDEILYSQVPRTDRKPMNTSVKVQTHIDDYFQKKFGFRPRGEGTFCTGYFSEARTYGKVYAIFPVGKFKYLWSPDIYDLYTNLPNIRVVSSKEDEEQIESLLKTYIDKNLYAAITKYPNEIMIVCEKYHAIRIHDKDDVNILKKRIS